MGKTRIFIYFCASIVAIKIGSAFASSCVENPQEKWRYCDPTIKEEFDWNRRYSKKWFDLICTDYNQAKIAKSRYGYTPARGASSKTCKCHNIVYNGQGDGNCQSVHNGAKWCYVIGEASGCSDKKISSNSNKFPWQLKTVYYSYKACQGNPKQEFVGNEAFSLGVELVGGFNLKRFGSERIDAPTPEACEAECFVNKDRCSAWTFILGSGSNECKTVAVNGVNYQCVFPFKYNGQTFNSCTTYDSENGLAWCAYEVAANGDAVRGKWADCQTGCPGTGSACRTVEVNGISHSCIFPFKYKGRSYNSCTKDDSENGLAWCAHQVDKNGESVWGKWADCRNGCPGKDGDVKSNNNNACYLKGWYEMCSNQAFSKKSNKYAVSGYSCQSESDHGLKCWSTDYNYPFDYCNLKQKDYAHVRSCYESVSYGSSGGVELGVNSNAGSFGFTKARGRYRRRLYTFVNGRWRAVRARRRG